MAKQEYTFRGKAKWAQVYKQSQYEDYRLNFFPDDATRKAIKATGTKCGIKDDKDGDGLYYTFRSKIKPPVVDKEGKPFTALIGNGSTVSIQLSVEDFTSQYGPNSRTVLLGVVVEEHVPYEKKEEQKALPA